MTRWLSISAAAEYTSFSPATIRRYIAQGILTVYTIGGSKRLDREQIDGCFKPEKQGKTIGDEELRSFMA